MKVCLSSLRQSQGLLASTFLFAVALTPQVWGQGPGQQVDYPILYVTQVPVTATTNTVVSIGGSHLGNVRSAPRGGDLMIYYPDGTEKNLTQSGGYGVAEDRQTGNSIAVRDPIVHWSGQRALFSMVIGSPANAVDTSRFYWQLYEIEGLGKNDSPVITRLEGQRADFNNIQPTYTSSDEIIFVSDQTLSGDRTIYPARNEQGGVSVTGLWSLDPATRELNLMDHSPSGSFKPFVDSYGRVVFSRWDHLQRDEEANEGGVDYSSEDPAAPYSDLWSDIFPEPLQDTPTSLAHKFDLFLPWTINQDGTGLLTMNHLGRHELSPEVKRARIDPNLRDLIAVSEPISPVGSRTRAGSYLQISEDLQSNGKYVATDAVSSAVSAGRLVTFSSPPDENADDVEVTVANNIGLARDSSYLTDGRLMGSFAPGPPIFGSYGGQAGRPGNIPESFIPAQDEPFRVRVGHRSVDLNLGYDPIPATQVTRINFIDGNQVTYSGPLWQLQPVEVVPRLEPATESIQLEEPELKMFGEAGVSPSALKRWLEQNNMAMVVSRNVTARDKNDRQQPYNLLVPNGVGSIADNGAIYRVSNLQFFQGDYVRGYKDQGVIDPSAGRRVTARVLHDDNGENIATSIPGSAKIAPDGSTAMFLPAGRATTWQLTDERGQAIVRERYWLTFKAGEMRSCANCHGNNKSDQLDRPTATNPPTALRTLLTDWNARHPEANAGVTPYQFWAEVNDMPGASPEDDANNDGMSNYEAFLYGFRGSDTPETDPVARSLTPFSLGRGADSFAVLTFTLNQAATGMRVVIESSADLNNWSQAAVLENGTPISDDGSIRVLTSVSPEQAARGLINFSIRVLETVSERPSAYFRLRFEEM